MSLCVFPLLFLRVPTTAPTTANVTLLLVALVMKRGQVPNYNSHLPRPLNFTNFTSQKVLIVEQRNVPITALVPHTETATLVPVFAVAWSPGQKSTALLRFVQTTVLEKENASKPTKMEVDTALSFLP